MAKNVKLKLANLFLDLGNPRYEEQANQAEALNTIATAQGDKLLALLRDIIEHGLNPSEMLIVAPMEPERGAGKNSHVVLEGNRRVAAMKLLRNPSILRDEKLKAKYVKLHDKHKDRLPKQIDCVVLKPEVARLWIERKHEGELGGIGTVQWDSVQKDRFNNKNSGKDSKALQLIDFMKGLCGEDEEFKAQVDKIGPTNFDRLFSTPEVRYKVGLDVKNGMFVAYHSPEEIIRGLRSVVKHMSNSSFTVDDIYYKEDRLDFIAKVGKDGELPDEANRRKDTWILREYQSQQGKTGEADNSKDKEQGGNQNQNENGKDAGKDGGEAGGKQRPTSRDTLVPQGLTLTIPNERINRLFVEMKDLELNESPNICAVMLRVFVEWSIDAFLETYEVKGEKKLNVDINRGIKGKFTDVVEKMKTLHCINPDHLKGIETAFSEDRESIFSFHTLNAYVHNNSFNPIPSELMLSWDNAQPFIEALWKAVSEKENKNKQKK